jgi:hypothetical protein
MGINAWLAAENSEGAPTDEQLLAAFPYAEALLEEGFSPAAVAQHLRESYSDEEISAAIHKGAQR